MKSAASCRLEEAWNTSPYGYRGAGRNVQMYINLLLSIPKQQKKNNAPKFSWPVFMFGRRIVLDSKRKERLSRTAFKNGLSLEGFRMGIKWWMIVDYTYLIIFTTITTITTKLKLNLRFTSDKHLTPDRVSSTPS